MKTTRALVAVLLLSFGSGCPDDTGGTDEGPADLYVAEPPCVSQPQTHVELLNACTSAQSVDKKPVLPLLRPDGTLPPLP